jgi:hypothetical protein
MGFIGIVVAFAAGLVAVAAMAQTAGTAAVFDMRGTWTGTRDNITDGATPQIPASAQISAAGPYRLTRSKVTYKIDGQDGRRFWGTISSDESGAATRLIGSLSVDGKWIYMAGVVGIVDAQVVDADTIESCYRHANAQSATVGCDLMKRQK